MIRELKNHGFRYLAAETFTPTVESPSYMYPDYVSGYYLMDPVFADAVREARQLGFTLVSYESNKNDRDKRQAQNLKEKIFDLDPHAKVLILAVRGRVSERVAEDGWEPLGY